MVEAVTVEDVEEEIMVEGGLGMTVVVMMVSVEKVATGMGRNVMETVEGKTVIIILKVKAVWMVITEVENMAEKVTVEDVEEETMVEGGGYCRYMYLDLFMEHVFFVIISR